MYYIILCLFVADAGILDLVVECLTLIMVAAPELKVVTATRIKGCDIIIIYIG